MYSFDGLIRERLQMSSTTGMNIATTGVLLRKALSVVTGVSSRTSAERAVFGWPMIGAATNSIAPVWTNPATTTNNTPTVISPVFPMPPTAWAMLGSSWLCRISPTATSSVNAPTMTMSVGSDSRTSTTRIPTTTARVNQASQVICYSAPRAHERDDLTTLQAPV